jgi:hypothetical protein
MTQSRTHFNFDKYYYITSQKTRVDDLLMHESSGSCCYLDYVDEVKNLLKHTEKVYVCEYDIPPDKKLAFVDMYSKTKGISGGSPHSFCNTSDYPVDELINLDHYVGYWEFTKNNENKLQGQFFAFHPSLKETAIIYVNTEKIASYDIKSNRLIPGFTDTSYTKQVENELSSARICTALAIISAGTACSGVIPGVISFTILFGSLGYLVKSIYKLENTNQQIEKTALATNSFFRNEFKMHSNVSSREIEYSGSKIASSNTV